MRTIGIGNKQVKIYGAYKLIPADVVAPPIDWSLYLTFDVADNEATITGLTDLGRTLQTLELPKEYNGVPVTAVAQGALAAIDAEGQLKTNAFTSVKFPNSIKTIGQAALTYNQQLTSVELGSVTTVGRHAFVYTGLQGVIIPSSIQELGEGAFMFLPSLTSVQLKDGTYAIPMNAFAHCSALTDLSIGSGITSIGDGAFSNCSSLTYVSIPSTVTSIGNNAFSNCTGLTGLPNLYSLTSLGTSAFSGCTGLQSASISGTSLTSIPNQLFRGCANLTDVYIGNEIQSIGTNVLQNCNKVATLNIPFLGSAPDDSTNAYVGYLFGASSGNASFTAKTTITNLTVRGGEYIASYAYAGLSALVSLNVTGTNVKTIGSYAFQGIGTGTTASASINISPFSSLESMSQRAFATSTFFVGFSNNTALTTIPSYAFDGHTQPNSSFIELPDSVTTLQDYAFVGYSGSTITLGSGLTTIGFDAFDGVTAPIVGNDCPNLEAIGNRTFYGYLGTAIQLMNAPIESIGDNAFVGCSNLTNITTGSGNNSIFTHLLTIGASAFQGCSSLGFDNIEATHPLESIGVHAFQGCALLREIDLPSSLTNIQSATFKNCGLWTVTIPNSITTIGAESFSGCSGISSFTYGGTMSEWESVTKGTDWNLDCLFTEVRCSDGSVIL